jgi:hypothetical protein
MKLLSGFGRVIILVGKTNFDLFASTAFGILVGLGLGIYTLSFTGGF